jgi:hypothetical protein
VKRWLLALLLTAAPAGAATVSVNQFSGLNTEDSALSLADGQSPDSENVVTDEGPGLSGRQGFIQRSTEPITGLWQFPKSDGTRYLIVRSSNTLKASLDGQSFTIAVASLPANTSVACAALGDRFYFVSTADGLKYWGGTAGSPATTVDATMTADKIAVFKGRVVIAGRTTNQRALYLSKYLDGTNFTTPTNPSEDDATTITVSGALDENIQGIYSTFQDKLMVFKKSSFGGLYGSKRSNFVLRTFSDSVGLSSQESVQDCDGLLRWLGANRDVWEFDGATLKSLTNQVTSEFDAIAQGDSASRSYTVTSGSDWAGVTYSAGSAFVDTMTVVGRMSTLFPETFDSVRDGSSGSYPLWTSFWHVPSFTAAQPTHSASASLSSSRLRFQNTNTADTFSNVTYQSSTTFRPGSAASGTTFYFEVPRYDTTGFISFYPALQVYLSTWTVPSGSGTSFPASGSAEMLLRFKRNNATSVAVDAFSLCGVSGLFGVITATVPFNVSMWKNSTAFSLTINGTVVTQGNVSSCDEGNSKLFLDFTTAASDTSDIVEMDTVGVMPQAITLTTPVQTLGTISAWNTFAATDGGTGVSYALGSSSTTSVTSFTTTSKNTTPTISTNTYAAIRATVSPTTTTTAGYIDDMTLNWVEGSTIPLASGYVDQRYWLSVTVSSTANNRIYVFDRDRQWQRYTGINASVMGPYNSRLLFGNLTGVYLTESGYTDNGTAITASFRTKTLAPAGLDLFSKYKTLYLTAENSDATLETDFRSDQWDESSLGTVVMNETPGIQTIKLPFSTAGVQQSRFIDLNWSVSGSSFWRLLNANLYFDPDTQTE